MNLNRFTPCRVALFGALVCSAAGLHADTLGEMLEGYGSDGVYLLSGAGTNLSLTSQPDRLLAGSVWSITVEDGAQLSFQDHIGPSIIMPSGSGGVNFTLTARNSGKVFFRNITMDGNNVYGGVIRKDTGILSLTGVQFSNNTATAAAGVALGGAIYHSWGTTTLTDVSFTGNTVTNNTAGQSAFGGAIYAHYGTLNLNVTGGQTAVYSGNKAQGAANSLHLRNTTLNIKTDAGGTLDMLDPMSGMGGLTDVDGTTRITKTGAGVWRLGGASVFTAPRAGNHTVLRVSEGTLRLYGQGEASTVEGVSADEASVAIAGTQSSFIVEGGATLIAAGNNSVSVTQNTAANAIDFKSGAAVSLLENARLQLRGNVAMDSLSLDFAFGDSAVNSADAALIFIDGTLSLALDSSYQVVLNNFAAGDYQLISATSIIGSTAGLTDMFYSDLDAATFWFSQDGNSLWVTVAVPEPATWAGIVAGLALTCAVLRRRAK